MNNVIATQNLLEECKKQSNLEKIIFLSTDEVYGESSLSLPIGHKEDATLNPTNPYAASKAAAECLMNAYRISYKLPIIITRSNNVYGPGQYPEKIIPKFIKNILNGDKWYIILRFLTVIFTRSYIFVNDLIDALQLIMEKGDSFIYNIGTNFEISNKELALALLSHFHLSDDHLEYTCDRVYNDCRYLLDYQKITILGWKFKITFEQGLTETIEWYKHNLNKWWR
ncbi:NAD(P)-binding protein [Rozella allomycis CSF55]|uniref:NAD(P)-binding protein n=1 Tax=Rozella allomycis (strain CSF55) TaxID=988480 RepID=A0A075AQK4_ROZAC|nr:NAD-dependent epimerase/dehydratase domain-containing protein [Rozella allomycis CSF55]RKP20486.1 NAD(P)-binding protein [Rozella allomycis CSF55]|eukprot:EPZ32503.1 NAD-dependent epimerase/dehydratase domain-containing protein [Rozella allomycis CSF55]